MTTDGMIVPSKLTTEAWQRLARRAGLQEEDWGEGWLALHEAGEGGEIPEELAVQCLEQIANRSQVVIQFDRAWRMENLGELAAA